MEPSLNRQSDDERTREDQGFRSIGSLLPRIANLPPGWDSTPPKSQPSSETTGSRCLVPKAGSSVGPAPSETAAARLLAGGGPTPEDRRAAERETEAWLRLPAQSWLGFKEVVQYEAATGQFLGVRWEFNPAAGTEAQRTAAMALLKSCPPRAPVQEIMGELTRLRVLTIARAEDQGDLTLKLAAYAEELSEFPIEVVRSACRGLAKREKWFPSWSELKADCDWRYAKARALRDALAKAARAAAGPENDPA